MFVQKRELIDTLWNVNLHNAAAKTKMLIELIDTLWNVNILARQSILRPIMN